MSFLATENEKNPESIRFNKDEEYVLSSSLADTGDTNAKADNQDDGIIIVVESRVLIRDCISRSLADVVGRACVRAYSELDEWIAEASQLPKPALILFCIGRRKKLDDQTMERLRELGNGADAPPLVLLSDGEDAEEILDALEQGIRGYIPTSATLDVAIEAMRLVKAGGVFVPASSIIAARHCHEGEAGEQKSRLSSIFTARQAEVVEALRQGKPNKVIAYDLNMQESTVKVHVRNIMKKLRAKNRTEVAYLTRDLFEQSDGD